MKSSHSHRAATPRPTTRGSRGLTLVEVIVALAITGILTAGGAHLVAKYGRMGRTRFEADQVVNGLWELRAKAATGMRNPCMDFPALTKVRFYSDTSATPNGFGSGDLILRNRSFAGGVQVQAISGGNGPTHFVCFRSKGIPGSTNSPLSVTLGSGSTIRKTVQLLPSTGMARIQ